MKQRSCVISFPCKFFREKKEAGPVIKNMGLCKVVRQLRACIHGPALRMTVAYYVFTLSYSLQFRDRTCQAAGVGPPHTMCNCRCKHRGTVERCKRSSHNQSLAEFWFWRITDTLAKKSSRISSAYESWLWQQTTTNKLWPSEKKWIETSRDNKAVC